MKFIFKIITLALMLCSVELNNANASLSELLGGVCPILSGRTGDSKGYYLLFSPYSTGMKIAREMIRYGLPVVVVHPLPKTKMEPIVSDAHDALLPLLKQNAIPEIFYDKNQHSSLKEFYQSIVAKYGSPNDVLVLSEVGSDIGIPISSLAGKPILANEAKIAALFDKIALHEVLTNANLPSPASYGISSDKDLKALVDTGKLTLPFLLKPSNGTGGIGNELVYDLARAVEVFSRQNGNTNLVGRKNSIMAQEFLNLSEWLEFAFDIEVVPQDESIPIATQLAQPDLRQSAVWKYIKEPLKTTGVPFYRVDYLMDPEDPDLKPMIKTMTDTIKSLTALRGTFHIEAFRNLANPRRNLVTDLSVRPGGGTFEALDAGMTVTTSDATILAAVRRDRLKGLIPRRKKFVAIVQLRADRTGTVNSVWEKLIDDFKKQFSPVDVQLVELGAKITPTTDLTNSLGEVIVSGDTQAELDAKVNGAIALEAELMRQAVD